MKRVLSSITLILALAITLVSCDSNSPKSVADKFLVAYYHLDFEGAKKVSTEETKKMLDMMQQFSTMIPDSSKKQAKNITVKLNDVKQKGADTAVVTYVTSNIPTEQTLNMVKVNGKWLVQWSKQDQMGGGATDGAPATEQPLTTDTAAATVPDTSTATTVDTTTK